MITKLFQNINLKVAFRTNNTIKQHVKIREKTTDTYSLSGVYQLTCGECPLKYIGQTGRTFRKRYNEHIREIKTNGQKSKFARHVLDAAHSHNTIDQTMEVLHIERKEKMLNALEAYHIYRLTKETANERSTDRYL
jgi:hypothetical protein